jgi:hypothetical protein
MPLCGEPDRPGAYFSPPRFTNAEELLEYRIFVPSGPGEAAKYAEDEDKKSRRQARQGNRARENAPQTPWRQAPQVRKIAQAHSPLPQAGTAVGHRLKKDQADAGRVSKPEK